MARPNLTGRRYGWAPLPKHHGHIKTIGEPVTGRSWSYWVHCECGESWKASTATIEKSLRNWGLDESDHAGL